MRNHEGSNKVSQKNNTVENGDIAGGNINKNTYQQGIIVNINIDSNGLKNYQELIAIVRQNETSFIPEILKNSFIQELIRNIKDDYESIIIDKNSMSTNKSTTIILQAAGIQLNKHQFGKAHKLFEDALADLPDEHYNYFFKQYLITGFIYYCQENNISGLMSLVSQETSVPTDDPEIALITANIFQEICSRDTDIDKLNQFLPKIETSYNNAAPATKSAMANSLGLTYRRLGERTGVPFLQKAIFIFDQGLKSNNGNIDMEVELKDQMAITYIRIFEYNNDEDNLSDAEKLLTECVRLSEFITDSRNYRLKPRVLNNLGNVHKQKVLFSGDRESADKAISCYVEAEKFWNEHEAKYEWALLQKNKAETRYGLAKVTFDPNLLLEGLEECLSSVKYRNLENSPYQWGKSVEIIFNIVLLLNELKSLSLIPQTTREEIILYIKEIDKDNSKWGAKNFKNLVHNANQAQTLLQKS